MQLVLIEFETFEQATYSFPDVDKEQFRKMIANVSIWKSLGSMVVTNISGACLVLPSRIIKTIRIDKEEVWTACPA